MYKAPLFDEKDPEKLMSFMKAHAFATVIGYNEGYPVATQVPLQIYHDNDGFRLVGHIMKKTDHHRAYLAHEQVLVMFTGAHTYISAAVYAKPAVASTWNYSTVQVKGKIRLMDSAETREVIKDLTNSFENPDTSPAAFHHMDDEYIDRHLQAISGFEIKAIQINTVFKLSQNHDQHNQTSIIANLASSADPQAHEVAQKMKENRKPFKN
jgi:transcriptional regulator